MRLEVRGTNVNVSDALRAHVERRLDFALGRFDDRVRRVSVKLEDVNGPRGGVDKRCRIRARVDEHVVVAVEEVGHTQRVAIDGAADRLKEAVRRAVQRSREAAAGSAQAA